MWGTKTPHANNRAQRRGDHGTPEGRQRRTSRPLQSRKSRACHAKSSTEARRPRDARGTPEAYITPLAEQKVVRLPRKIEHRGAETTGRQRDARDVHHAPCRAESRAPATQNRAQRRGDHGTPEGRQRRTSRPLQSRKSRACHAKSSTEARRPRDARGTPETYITPLAEQKVARLPRKIEHRGAEPKGRQRDARDVHHAPCRAESRAPATQNRAHRRGDHGTPEGRQRRTSRPLQSRKSRACHAK